MWGLLCSRDRASNSDANGSDTYDHSSQIRSCDHRNIDWDLIMRTEDESLVHPRIDGQGIALLLIAGTLAFLLYGGVLWMGLR